MVQQGGILSSLEVGEHLLHILRDLYSRSWFITRFSIGFHVVCTRAGSRPGSAFADLVFACIYHRILTHIKAEAMDAGICVPIPRTGLKCPWAEPGQAKAATYQALDSTWADDTAVATSSRSPAELIDKSAKLIAIVLSACKSHGLKPNLKKGKSALMLGLRGTGSRKAAAAAFAGNAKELPVVLEDGTRVVVHVEAAYVHLGTFLDRDGCLLGEARRRVAMAGRAFEHLRALVLQNQHLEVATRASLFKGAVESVLFNLEVWTESDRERVGQTSFLRIACSCTSVMPAHAVPEWRQLAFAMTRSPRVSKRGSELVSSTSRCVPPRRGNAC